MPGSGSSNPRDASLGSDSFFRSFIPPIILPNKPPLGAGGFTSAGSVLIWSFVGFCPDPLCFPKLPTRLSQMPAPLLSAGLVSLDLTGYFFGEFFSLSLSLSFLIWISSSFSRFSSSSSSFRFSWSFFFFNIAWCASNWRSRKSNNFFL